MQRVYLLLRKNQQSGPFTIGELLQQQLRPTDMIWVEGESNSWTPVAQLELRPHEAPSPANPSDKGVQRNAEEWRAGHAHLHQPKVYVEKPGEPIPATAYSEEDAIVLIDHRKEKRTMLNEVAMTLLVVALFAGGFYGSQTLFAAKKDVVTTTPTKMEANDENAAKPAATRDLAQESTPMADSLQSSASSLASVPKKVPAKKAVDSLLSNTDQNAVAVTDPPVVTPTEVPKADLPPAKVQDVPEKKKEKTEPAPDKQDKSNNEKLEEPEKKKGFLRNLFKKKKKDDDGGSEEKEKNDQ